MTYEKATYYWSRGFIAEKMQAVRIAGHMWGTDVDAATSEEKPNPEDVSRQQFESDFGMSYDEYLKMLP